MGSGARTPKELEALFEDALVIRDRGALAELFEDGAVLVADDRRRSARGREEVARLAAEMWERGRRYVADPWRVLQARNTALVVAEGGINVLRRGGDGAWRYAIAVLSPDDTTAKEEQ